MRVPSWIWVVGALGKFSTGVHVHGPVFRKPFHGSPCQHQPNGMDEKKETGNVCKETRRQKKRASNNQTKPVDDFFDRQPPFAHRSLSPAKRG